jgi:hypothetical protein
MADQSQDWIAETEASVKARLEAVKASQAQTRVTLGAMAIISAMMLIALYNAYFSYDYRYITTNIARTLGNSNIPDVLMGQAARDWTSARTIQISLLGIRVSVDDAAVLGTAVLTILSFWLVLVTRRENHALGLLLRDTDARQAGSPNIQSARWLILHTIAANALFETTQTSLEAIRTLRGPNPLTQTRGGLRRWANEYSMSFLRKFFFVFPTVTALLAFGIDRYSYFIADPFNPNGTPPGIADPFFWPSMVPFFACLIPLVLACLKANDFSLATESVLREYAVKLFRDLVPETEHRRSDRFVVVDAR